MAKITVEVSKDFLFEACALVHRKWSAEYDLMKKVKEEKPDGEPDWDAMHALRLANHKAILSEWDRYRLEAGELSSKLITISLGHTEK